MTRIFLHFTFLFMVHLVQNLKIFSKFEVHIRSSVVILPKLGRSSKFGHSKFERPNLGMTTATELRESERWPPQLRIRPPTWKIHQWNHNIWSSGIFRRSVFRHSNSVVGLSTFSPFRRLVIRHSVIRCWVPFRPWVQFGIRSFGVRSFGVPSFGIRSFGVRSFGIPSFSIL